MHVDTSSYYFILHVVCNAIEAERRENDTTRRLRQRRGESQSRSSENHRSPPDLASPRQRHYSGMKDKEIDMAISSRSPTSEIAKRFLDKFGIRSIFVAKEIYSSWTRKREHFDKIHWTTGVPYSRMLFFDDENRNIEAVSQMGVTSIYVNNGVNLRALREGLLSFSHKCGSSGAV
uniref:Magnesium-dependent phosphatase 1 n=1 Tax=Kalanchoe fedtschenkoi TaxID=63787 RepID=A0A7N0VNC3_KALFE